jgi:putative transposase
MQVSTSAFYAWNKAPEDTDKKVLQKQLEAKAIQLFDENKKIYGSRRLSEAFIKEDFQVGRYKAKQLMKTLGRNRVIQNASKLRQTAIIMMQFLLIT